MYQRQRSCAYFIAPVGACVLAGILVSWYRVPGRGKVLAHCSDRLGVAEV